MPFVNEFIPPEDVEKYGLKEIDKHFVVGGRTRTIGRSTGSATFIWAMWRTALGTNLKFAIDSTLEIQIAKKAPAVAGRGDRDVRGERTDCRELLRRRGRYQLKRGPTNHSEPPSASLTPPLMPQLGLNFHCAPRRP